MHIPIIAAALAASTALPATTPAPGVPAAPETPRPVVSRADVDGDRRADTIRLDRRRVTADEYTFRLTVTTARGKRAIRDVLVPNYLDGTLTPAEVWNGTAALDGVRGVEINVERSGNVGDVPWPHVYTWRNGRIVPTTAPNATAGDTGWAIADHFTMVAGYDVRTVQGQRQLTATHLTGRFVDTDTLHYRGTHTTYRWHRGDWRRVRSVTTGWLSESKALSYAGWKGVTWRR